MRAEREIFRCENYERSSRLLKHEAALRKRGEKNTKDAPSPRQVENVRSEKLVFAVRKTFSPAGQAEGADQKPIKNCPQEGWYYSCCPGRLTQIFVYQALSSTFIRSAQVCPSGARFD